MKKSSLDFGGRPWFPVRYERPTDRTASPKSNENKGNEQMNWTGIPIIENVKDSNSFLSKCLEKII
jgi:hypothetical protein